MFAAHNSTRFTPLKPPYASAGACGSFSPGTCATAAEAAVAALCVGKQLCSIVRAPSPPLRCPPAAPFPRQLPLPSTQTFNLVPNRT